MASSTSRSTRRRAVRVHRAEVSTDRDSLLGYAEPLALLLAVVAFVVAGWIAARPSEGADLMRPAPESAPIAQMQVSNAATPRITDVVQPIPAGPGSTTAPGMDGNTTSITPSDQASAVAG